MVDQIADALKPIDNLSVLDIGCNTGYFPLAFARKGAPETMGINWIDYAPNVVSFNRICGTSVQFATGL